MSKHQHRELEHTRLIPLDPRDFSSYRALSPSSGSLADPIFAAKGGLQTSGLLKLFPLLKSAGCFLVLFKCRSNEHREDEGNFRIDLGVQAVQGDFAPRDGLRWLRATI